MLAHPDNDHWSAWREAVNRTGYNMALAHASRVLQEIESLSPSAFESFTANLYRTHVGTIYNREGFLEVSLSSQGWDAEELNDYRKMTDSEAA